MTRVGLPKNRHGRLKGDFAEGTLLAAWQRSSWSDGEYPADCHNCVERCYDPCRNFADRKVMTHVMTYFLFGRFLL